MNQNQSWNLSLEGAWNSTTVNGITENRTFNEVYEILTSNSNPLTHDRKGNLTQNKDSSQYTWDYNNQLSHAVNASSENASYTYDALGRRISKQVNGITTVYVNVGYQIATEYQSTDGINFTEKQSYVYATYIDDPLVLVKASGERFYYHSNGQFSISKITDEYKNVVEAYAYNAYGDVQILQSYAGLDNPYYFTGRQLDQETGLFYFRARYYDAKLGQFISRDPIGYVDGLSLYRGYFAVNGAGPLGLWDLLDVLSVGTDFMRGAVDGATMGLTRYAREALWSAIGNPEAAEVIHENAYVAGEIVETVGEVALTGGVALTKKAGQKFIQEVGKKEIDRLRKKAIRQARKELDKEGRSAVHKGKQGHHKIPVYEGKSSDPRKADDSKNIEFLEGQAKVKGTEHHKAHRKLKRVEKVDDVREKTQVIRPLINEVGRNLETSCHN